MRQQKMGRDFMSAKLELHRNEDPVFLPDLSDVFNMRIWKVTKFEKGEEELDGFLKELLLKLMNNEAGTFHEDLEEDDVQQEIVEMMRIIYTHHQNEKILTGARENIHITDQRVFIINHVPDITEKTYLTWFRLVKRAAAAPNAQIGTERVNSDCNLAKTKVSCSMKDEMILTRI